MKFPIDLKPKKVFAALKQLGFTVERNSKNSHIVYSHSDGRKITIPQHNKLKASMMQTALKNAGISKKEFLAKL